jgi:transcriptional regulator with XRE-family HTH domain
MTNQVNAAALRRQMIMRGWTGADLARESRLSAATVSSALAGRPIAVSSLFLIAQALIRCPLVPIVGSLLAQEAPKRQPPTGPTLAAS